MSRSMAGPGAASAKDPGGDRPLDYPPVLLAVAVGTAGVLPAFLAGGLAVQIRSEMDFGSAALGLAVAVFFVTASLASVVMGRVVEKIGAHRAMRVAAVGSAAALLGVALFAGSWAGLVVCLVLGGLANAVAHPATHLSLARRVPANRPGFSFGKKQAAQPAATPPPGPAVPIIAVTPGWGWAFPGGAALAIGIALLVPAETLGGVRKLKEARAGDVPTAPLVLLAVG